MTHKYPECLPALIKAGISESDAYALRRISMQLNRWFEKECGDANGNAVERDEVTGKTYLTYDLGNNGKRARIPTPDMETSALARLKKIMTRYPTLTSYVQGDPRGCALYILRPSDIREGCSIDSCYSNGMAVYK